MILNSDSLATFQAEWQGVARMRDRIRHLVVTTFTLDAKRSPIFGDILYNLPFMLAFDVLKQVLLEAKEEGLFTGSRRQLADLMDNAKTSLPWLDWQDLREGVKRRNEVRRDGKLYGDIQCLRDIAQIEAQLVAWGIIPAARP